MVKENDLFCSLVRQDFAYFLESFRSLKQCNKENFHIMIRPDISLFVLHFIFQRVFYKFELF